MTKLRKRILELRAKGMKPKDIAQRLGCKPSYVYNVKPDSDEVATTTITIKPFDPSSTSPNVYGQYPKDMVNHPDHYKVGGIETIDFIEAKKLNYNLGNAVKYISRAPYKGKRIEDLQKAVWYLNREIEAQQGEVK